MLHELIIDSFNLTSIYNGHTTILPDGILESLGMYFRNIRKYFNDASYSHFKNPVFLSKNPYLIIL